MKLLNWRPGYLIQTEGLSAVIAGGVAIAIGDYGFACLRREPARRLDRMDIYELLLTSSWLELAADLIAGGLAFTLLNVVDSFFYPRNSIRERSCSASLSPVGSDCLKISLRSSRAKSAS